MVQWIARVESRKGGWECVSSYESLVLSVAEFFSSPNRGTWRLLLMKFRRQH